MTGRFITIEGGEGVGKSTQIAKLAAALKQRGLDVVKTREPGGSPGAEQIRTLLLSGDLDSWSPRTEALLFAAARADHVEKSIAPALERGAWVVSDRYIDSNRAYQGQAGDIGDEDILKLHTFGSGGLMPDRTLVLSLAPDVARQRARDRDSGQGDRFEQKNVEYHDAVSDFLDKLSHTEAPRVVRVDASGKEQDVHEKVMAALADILP